MKYTLQNTNSWYTQQDSFSLYMNVPYNILCNTTFLVPSIAKMDNGFPLDSHICSKSTTQKTQKRLHLIHD